jgi:hypothetical protein
LDAKWTKTGLRLLLQQELNFRSCLPSTVLICAFLALTIPVIEFGKNGAYDYDERTYHFPTVENLARKWPALSLRDDPISAVSPGYHYFLGSILHFAGGGLHGVRYVNLIVSLAIPLVLFGYGKRYSSGWRICIVLLPLIFSNFIIKSASRVVTDNASLLLVTLVLAVVLSEAGSIGRSAAGGVFGASATFVRQLQAWLVFPMLVRSTYVSRSWTRERVAAIIFALFPLIVLGFLYAAWDGLVPPVWRNVSVRVSFASIAYLLTVFGFFGAFFVPFETIKDVKNWLADGRVQTCTLVGLFCAIVSPTSYNYAEGRWGGYFWAAVQRLPNIEERSLFFIIAAPLGASVVAILWKEMHTRGATRVALIWVVSVISWAGTFLINRQVFHRYYEPMVLVFLIFATFQLEGLTASRSKHPLWRIAVLGLLQAAISMMTIFRGMLFTA